LAWRSNVSATRSASGVWRDAISISKALVIALVIETADDGADGPPMTTAIGHAVYFHSLP